jgi:hypothetical protein
LERNPKQPLDIVNLILLLLFNIIVILNINIFLKTYKRIMINFEEGIDKINKKVNIIKLKDYKLSIFFYLDHFFLYVNLQLVMMFFILF